MIYKQEFNNAKLSQIKAKIKELDAFLDRNLPPVAEAIEAKKCLKEAGLWVQEALNDNN